jgi:hypothetical protein
MSSSLSLHSPKFNAKLTDYGTLAALPVPQAMGPFHKPIPHVRLIDALRHEVVERGYGIEREAFALAAKGQALFGVIDLKPSDAAAQRCLSLGFRNSVDTSMAAQLVAGITVFVCDNMALSGSMIAMNRKNTTGLDLGDAVAQGFDKFLLHAQVLDVQITRLQATAISDGAAKQLIYDVFSAKVVPARLFDDVDTYYFRPTAATPETQDRTLWGLHNAFTRAMRDLTPGASVRGVGRPGPHLRDAGRSRTGHRRRTGRRTGRRVTSQGEAGQRSRAGRPTDPSGGAPWTITIPSVKGWTP